MARVSSFIRLIRPHQWIKNGFVFIGVLFGTHWDEPALHADVLLLFAAFCLVSSAVYAVNDIFDREADARHPVKRQRPLPSGELGLPAAIATALVLGAAGLALAARVSLPALLLAAIYVAINLAYSAGLKHVAVLDVFIISAGFMLRILAGTTGIGIVPSNWLLLCGLMLTLFLGFSKRRAELLTLDRGGPAAPEGDGAHGQRRVLADYSPALLDRLIGICAAGTAIGYALYTVDAETVRLHDTDKLILTVPFVLYGLFRYLHRLYSLGGGADAAWDLWHDPHLIAAIVGWLGVVGWLLVP